MDQCAQNNSGTLVSMNRMAFLDSLEPGSELDYLMAVLTDGDVGVLNPQSGEGIHDGCRLSREEVDAMLDELGKADSQPQKTASPPRDEFWSGDVSLSPEELDILSGKAG